MNESKKMQRVAYRSHMRSEFRGIVIFALLIYVMTFSGVALFVYLDAIIGGWFFGAHHTFEEAPKVLAMFWANLILTIYLIAIAVLYVSGGPAGIPFLALKKNIDD